MSAIKFKGTQHVPCICEICNCGRHKCKHHCPKKQADWGQCVLSEYAMQYHPHCFDMVKPILPQDSTGLSNEPLSSITTHKTDFIPLCLEPPYHKEREEYKKPTEKMENSTNYRNEYTPKLCPPVKQIKHFEQCTCPVQFQGEPTYRSDYRPWKLTPIKTCAKSTYKPSTKPFDDLTLYRSAYVSHCLQKNQAFRPENQIQMSDLPFDGTTNYRHDFLQHPIEPRCLKAKEVVERSTAPLETLSTTKKDYTPKEFCPIKPFASIGSLTNSSEPLSNHTTNRDDFRPHEICIYPRHESDKYKPPTTAMDLNSSYRNDYPVRAVCLTNAIQMPETQKCDAPFQSDTNYRNDYRPWDVKPNHKKPQIKWEPSLIPFDGLSTNKSEFVPRKLCPSKPFHPESNITYSGPFDGTTNYRTEYTKKICTQHCPAAYLRKDKISVDGYKFKMKDDCGHEYYEQLKKAPLTSEITAT